MTQVLTPKKLKQIFWVMTDYNKNEMYDTFIKAVLRTFEIAVKKSAFQMQVHLPINVGFIGIKSLDNFAQTNIDAFVRKMFA